MLNILIIGAGKLGLPLANQLNHLGHRITTLSKNHKEVAMGITHICADVHSLTEHSFNGHQFDWVYVILTPYERNEFGYTNAYVNSVYPIANALKNQPIQRLIYVSSTQVYGQNQGEQIDDETHPIPSSDFGKILYAGELVWQAFFKDKLTIIRPSGLIGNDGNFLINQANSLTDISECHYLNLIKREDVITILAHLPNHQDTLLGSYILSTNSIARHDLLNKLRQNMGLPIIKPNDNLPITGKKLIAKRLKNLLREQNIQLSEI